MRVIVTFSLIIALMGCGSDKDQEEKTYRLRAGIASEAVFGEAQACIAQCRLHVVTLEYARVVEVDFATAQAATQTPSSGDSRSMVRAGRITVDEHMGRVPERPETCEEMHIQLGALYATYEQIYELATNPGRTTSKLDVAVNKLEEVLFENKEAFNRSATRR